MREAGFAMLFALGLGVVVVACGHIEPSCYERVQVGMPSVEAIAIVERNGYALTGGDGNMVEAVMVFTRHKWEPAIVLVIDSRSCRVTNKELDSAFHRLR